MLENIDGLILESKFPQLQYIIKGPIQDEWRDGIPVRRPKHIVLEFDRHLLIMDDLAREKEWDEEDKEFIRKQVNYELDRPDFTDFWEHKLPVPNPPWPTYDATHHAQVASIAQSIGLVAEALRYETMGRPGGPRESVVAKLEGMLAFQNEETPFVQDEDELAAV